MKAVSLNELFSSCVTAPKAGFANLTSLVLSDWRGKRCLHLFVRKCTVVRCKNFMTLAPGDQIWKRTPTANAIKGEKSPIITLVIRTASNHNSRAELPHGPKLPQNISVTLLLAARGAGGGRGEEGSPCSTPSLPSSVAPVANTVPWG